MKHLNLFLLLIIFSSVDSIEESFCAGTGYYSGSGHIQPPLSMGWSKLNKDPHGRLWGANHAVSSGSESDRIIIEMRKVEEPQRGKYPEMNGWLQVKIKTKDSSHKIQVLAVWALTDTRESLGEFVSTKSAKCESFPAASYTDENIVPCAAAPINEPSNPNMFVYVNKGKGPLTGEVNLLWKTSVSYCNFPKKFRFMVAINTKAWGDNPSGPNSLSDATKGPRVYASQWISPKFYGPAAAPLFDKNQLKCSTAISPANRPQWIKSITGTNVINNELTVFLDEDPWFNPRWGSGDSQNANNFAQRTTCKPKSGKHAFAGRCKSQVGSGFPDVSPSALHSCPTNNNFEPSDLTVFQGKYQDYLKKRENTLRENCDCPPIPSADEVRQAAGSGRKRRMVADVDDNDAGGDEDDDEDDPLKGRDVQVNDGHNEIDPPVRPYGENLLSKCVPHGVSNESFTKDEQGLCANSQPGKMSYGVRQWHAVSILFCVVVLNPVTSYMARFLKGTFSFTGKTPIPIKTWYIVSPVYLSNH
ncbi:unnamed protein product [Orchesella dallaii]|uniref:Uncharacterized protein n=1 Tax=Orchesella dallaii TaxID=48710 RepID=A0ABP1R8M8_9HEXA